MAVDLDSYEVWLLIDDEMLYPFSSHGFQFAQGRLVGLLRRSSSNSFLRANGDIYKIAKIRPIRNDLQAKVLRLFGRPFEIQVEIAPHHIDLTELKSKIACAMENYSAMGDPDESWPFAMLPLSEVRSAIFNAKNAKELYSVLALPSPRHCLDLL